jgi:hypothetical protein
MAQKFVVGNAKANPKKNGLVGHVIDADNIAQALEVAQAAQDGDGDWDAADITFFDPADPIAADYKGFAYRIRVGRDPVTDPLSGPDTLDITYVGVGKDGVNDIGDGLAALIAAEGGAFVGAAYATPNLKIAGAGIGNRKISVEAIPATCVRPVPSLIGALTHDGAVGDILAVALVIPANDPPATIPLQV